MNEQKDCLDMIFSLLAYGYFHTPTDEIVKNRYLQEYVKSIGKRKVKKLIDFARDAIEDIKQCVATDSEGCEYNSIVFKKGSPFETMGLEQELIEP